MKRNKPCPQCKTLMELKHTTLHFEREGFYADVENVSAYICPQCGTRSIPGSTAIKIGKTIDELLKHAKAVETPHPGELPAFIGRRPDRKYREMILRIQFQDNALL